MKGEELTHPCDGKVSARRSFRRRAFSLVFASVSILHFATLLVFGLCTNLVDVPQDLELPTAVQSRFTYFAPNVPGGIRVQYRTDAEREWRTFETVFHSSFSRMRLVPATKSFLHFDEQSWKKAAKFYAQWIYRSTHLREKINVRILYQRISDIGDSSDENYEVIYKGAFASGTK